MFIRLVGCVEDQADSAVNLLPAFPPLVFFRRFSWLLTPLSSFLKVSLWLSVEACFSPGCWTGVHTVLVLQSSWLPVYCCGANNCTKCSRNYFLCIFWAFFGYSVFSSGFFLQMNTLGLLRRICFLDPRIQRLSYYHFNLSESFNYTVCFFTWNGKCKSSTAVQGRSSWDQSVRKG